ncbi:hypothetical protein L207DRAFT_628436 [Hyaloscypha variabilis F]|uniref:Uncharacterized protein n=1 Tax=Hyaloscypha variabilis (strain UAMH 11265 / GT02V1 / F) TaxID=1149755 RepID=A0A2J6SAT1_HYAVF|nr:hypothetical protein L207DRAFT_628436 [Hyaloscypha variabilis F]
MVCDEYLDVINAVVRDAYHYTYPRAITADGYIRPLKRSEAPPSYDEAWRQQVMERAFKRMVDKDKILTSKQTEWKLHPDFDAKRFFKVRDSADWVSQIYSTYTPEQHRSRVALQSLESFLDGDLAPISSRQLVKLFGPPAGEEYDSLQLQDEKIVKAELAPELVDLNRISSMADTTRNRVEIVIDGSDEHNSSGSEPSSPIPLFTPMSSPPALQSARSSFEVDRPGTSRMMAGKPREEAAALPDLMIIDNPNQEVRVEARAKSKTTETPRQELHIGPQPTMIVQRPRQETSSVAQSQMPAIEKPGEHQFQVAQPGKTMVQKPVQTASAGPISDKVDLESLISRHPWLPSAVKRTQERFPVDSFELVVSQGTLKFKCNDCPLNLYKAIYPGNHISNFEAHLKTEAHRRNVAVRLGVAPGTTQHSSPALSKIPKSRVSGVAAQSSTYYDQAGNKNQRSTAERESLIVILPIGRPLNAANARKHARVLEPSQFIRDAFKSDDGVKRRRLDSGAYSTNSHTVKARARAVNLDSRAKEYKESYARSHGGYNELTKECDSAVDISPAPASSLRRASYTDAATDSRAAATEKPQSKAEQEAFRARGEHQKYHSSDDEIESQFQSRKDLESEIKASESSHFSNMVLGEKRASLSGLLSLLEKRSEIQGRNFTAQHQLQVSTSEEVALLRTTSTRHDQELETIKHSAKREKEWRKYFDKSTKEDRGKLARLEAKVNREREDKQNFKMSMEGRVDAMIKHHQISSDASTKKVDALEKLVMEQSKQLEEQNKRLQEQGRLLEMLTKRALTTEKEPMPSPSMAPKPNKERDRASLPSVTSKPPLRPAWAKK